jgi:hypothetical protein
MKKIIRTKSWDELYEKLKDEGVGTPNIIQQIMDNIDPKKPVKQKELCLHDTCRICNGTGKTKKGVTCVHYISCRCHKCTPSYGT